MEKYSFEYEVEIVQDYFLGFKIDAFELDTLCLENKTLCQIIKVSVKKIL